MLAENIDRIMTGVEVNILSYVIDDDPDMLKIIGELLKAHDIKNYHLFSKAEEFLNNLGSDIVVCVIDYYLRSGLTGLDVLKAVKKKHAGSFVIMVSGCQNYKEIVALLNYGTDRYVDKNAPDYLEKLAEYMIEGLHEAQKRWGFLKFLEDEVNRTKRNESNPAL